jgi:sulfate transport system ATP-binding protein
MALELSRLSRRFTGYAALDDVSLSIAPGEFLALLGPSGSGKTTLLRILAGLDYPDTGAIDADGRNLLTVSARDRKVGLVFQHYALFQHLTVAENVAFGLRVRPWRTRPKRAEIVARVERLLRRVQLEDMSNRYPAQLSGGQRQRVALARALAVEPDLLLLDEPFGALDAQVRVTLRRWLRALHEDLGLTTVFVTHDQEEALELADRIAVMNRGRIEQVGNPAAIYEAPATRFVAEFIGRMNMFTGVVTPERGVRLGDQAFAIDVPGEIASGASVHVAIRPERARLTPARAADGISLPGTVRQVFYLGATREVHVDLASGDKGFVQLHNDGSDAGVAAGSAVWLSASATNCRVLPAR